MSTTERPFATGTMTTTTTTEVTTMTATPETAPGRLSEHVPVRFPEDLAAAAKRLAEQDGMSTSAWVRRIVDGELAARSGKCPTCGHAEDPSTPAAPESPA